MKICKAFLLNLETVDQYNKAMAYVKLQGKTMSAIISDIIKNLSSDYEKFIKNC